MGEVIESTAYNRTVHTKKQSQCVSKMNNFRKPRKHPVPMVSRGGALSRQSHPRQAYAAG